LKRRISILGSGKSGLGAALLASQNNYEVFVSDFNLIKGETKKIFNNKDIEWEENKHSFSKIINSELIVKSPGISDSNELIKKINELKIPVISEIEFASRFTKGDIVAITGTNGKTTTTLLISKIFKDAGFDVLTAGNIGVSFAHAISIKDYKLIVLEVSSFQLDGIIDFKPKVSVILNITEDHLDRYNYNFSKYTESKYRITENQEALDFLIFNEDQIKSIIPSN